MRQDVIVLPETPGVYIFRNEKNRVLYVGKAINLKNRVSSYFQSEELLGTKTRALVQKIVKIDHIKVESEIEALLLESDLIKRYKPPYNIELKDDKFYKYIKIDYDIIKSPQSENNINTNLFRITTSRKKLDKENSRIKYFGPYPDAGSIRIIIKTLRKIFPFRDCSMQKFSRYKKAKRPCLYGYIGVCPAPCIHNEAIETSNNNIKKFIDYIKGDRKKLFQTLENEMKVASKSQEFEKAAQLRDQLVSYQYLTQPKRNAREYIERPTLLNEESESGVLELINELNKINFNIKTPEQLNTFRIEIFDISNFQGKNAVGSMVVLTGGNADKSQYRKFKIQLDEGPNDFAMMQEMLSRRFSKKNANAWKLPNLIVVDGGKGQLSSAIDALEKSQTNIPIIGLAKRLEEIIYVKENGHFAALILEKSNAAIKTLQRGRDEAHRFAITYYRKLHRQKIYN